MTTAIVARGSEWSQAELHDLWGADIPEDVVKDLAKLVVVRFHELVRQHGADGCWSPYVAEVTARVRGEGPRMWEQVYPLPDGVTYAALRDQAIDEVWDSFVGEHEGAQVSVPLATAACIEVRTSLAHRSEEARRKSETGDCLWLARPTGKADSRLFNTLLNERPRSYAVLLGPAAPV